MLFHEIQTCISSAHKTLESYREATGSDRAPQIDSPLSPSTHKSQKSPPFPLPAASTYRTFSIRLGDHKYQCSHCRQSCQSDQNKVIGSFFHYDSLHFIIDKLWFIWGIWSLWLICHRLLLLMDFMVMLISKVNQYLLYKSFQIVLVRDCCW